MTHRMMLVSHDFTKVHSIVVARRKADVVSTGKTSDPYSEVDGSNPFVGSRLDEQVERLAEID